MTVVPLKQSDLFTKLWKSVELVDPSELGIHIALVARLRHELRDDVIFYHPANGEYRDKRSVAKLKAMGVLPGVSDLVFHWRDVRGRATVLFLELKVKGRKPSDAQLRFFERVQALGIDYHIADSVDGAMAIVGSYGLLKGVEARP